MEIKDRGLNEKINQLKKGLEIVGCKSNLLSDDNSEILNYIIEKTFSDGIVKFNINNIDYSINELIKCKQAYEIYFLKNKLTTLNSIVYKIKKYDTSLDSLIRKYKKSRSLEEYNDITKRIKKTYRLDINKLVLNSINSEILDELSLEEQESFYSEYLSQKRKQIIDGVISKMGIV
ncbi:MAG: hypothetical protein KHZ99_00525 [Clostridium sp.]|uniref:hypothetical protein n=1 Tax=Clostridium sp. TaxID=1506 RepID=UPI0025C08B51|nr:hypothetical protein [Clostridium sp.]MBS4955523.1 hypothetical protein [Clostridium sp.]